MRGETVKTLRSERKCGELKWTASLYVCRQRKAFISFCSHTCHIEKKAQTFGTRGAVSNASRIHNTNACRIAKVAQNLNVKTSAPHPLYFTFFSFQQGGRFALSPLNLNKRLCECISGWLLGAFDLSNRMDRKCIVRLSFSRSAVAVSLHKILNCFQHIKAVLSYHWHMAWKAASGLFWRGGNWTQQLFEVVGVALSEAEYTNDREENRRNAITTVRFWKLPMEVQEDREDAWGCQVV